jgi:hypothetical protein
MQNSAVCWSWPSTDEVVEEQVLDSTLNSLSLDCYKFNVLTTCSSRLWNILMPQQSANHAHNELASRLLAGLTVSAWKSTSHRWPYCYILLP